MASLWGFIVVFLAAALFNILSGAPLSALGVLWVNFTVIVFMAIGLGMGAASPEIMTRPPRQSGVKIIPNGLMAILILAGIVMAVTTLAVAQYAVLMGWGNIVAQTMSLTTFSLACIFVGLAYYDETSTVFNRDILHDNKLVKMTFFAVLATFLAVELDLLNRLLVTSDLNIGQWILCIVAGSMVLWVLEIVKIFKRRSASSKQAPATAAS
jgi:Ca2+-transporting ATPase